MDKLNIDFNSLLPYVIDAYSSIYGEEYRPIISKKLNNSIIVFYHDYEGLSNYVSYLKKCKGREFAIRFLDEIGIDVEEHKKENYTEPLDESVADILENLIDSVYGFSNEAEKWSPLLAFDSNNKTKPSQLLDNKLKIVNYLLVNNHDKITKENFDSFTKREEYLQLLEKINKLKDIYGKLLSEYNDWAKELEPYEKYVENEENRKKEIIQKKTDEFIREIIDKLPLPVKDSLSNKTLKEQKKCLLGANDVSCKSNIESFSYEEMRKLSSPNVNLFDKYFIVSWQSKYLKELGITIPNEKMLDCESEEDITNYLSFVNQDDIRKYIPTEEVISYISSTKEKKYEETLREYYTTRKDFINAMKIFDNNQHNFEYIYKRIKNKQICIAGQGGYNNKNELISIMFYTVGVNGGGYLFNSFVHESGHIIDQNQKGSGFEAADDFNEDSAKNPYDKTFRKYEKINETLNDIFTIEAVNYLQSQGIYLIEPKEYTKMDASNVDTSSLNKEILKPLIERFRKQVIKAKVNSEPQELIKYIGKDNFEELVDVVNKVDYLSRNGVKTKIDKSPEDPMVIDYYEQVERAKHIYNNIDNYYANNFGDTNSSVLEETAKTR